MKDLIAGRIQKQARERSQDSVLHVITGLGSGGAEAMLAKLVKSSKGFTHHVVSLAGPGVLGPEIEATGVHVQSLPSSRHWGLATGLPILANLIHRHRPQIVQGWMNHGNFAATLGVTLARSQAVLLWNVRQSLVDMNCEKWLTRRIIGLSARLSGLPQLIIYNSQAGAASHEAIGFSPRGRRIVPNGFDLAQFSPSADRRRETRAQLGLGDDQIVIGLIARLHKMKNHHAFFEAATRLMATEPRIRLLLAGEGVTADNPALRELIHDTKVLERSLLLGRRNDIPELTRCLDIACNVSLHGEGFANAIGEAMACGVPCIVTDIGDSARIIGETGRVCEGTDASAILAEMQHLVRAGATGRAMLGAAARARAEANYSIEDVAGQYERLYRQALDSVENNRINQ